MWRKNAVLEKSDSDQSLSEEEDLGDDWSENLVFSGGPLLNKEGVKVLSQLDKLRDSHEIDGAMETCVSSQEKQGPGSEDEVEFPVFNDAADPFQCPRVEPACFPNDASYSFPTMASVCNSDEEIVSDNEKSSPPPSISAKPNVAGTWSEVNREADELAHSHEIAACSSSYGVSLKVNRPSRGGRAKAKPKFLFRLPSHKEEIQLVTSNKNEIASFTDNLLLSDKLDTIAQRSMKQFMTEAQEKLHKSRQQPQKQMVPCEANCQYVLNEGSMAESLDCFQENSSLLQENARAYICKIGGRPKPLSRSSIPVLGSRNMDDDDQAEALDSGSSSEDEEKPRSRGSVLPRRTMVDEFQEALGNVSKNHEVPLVLLPQQLGGLFRQLQRVMQSERERDTAFLKNLCSEANLKDKRSSIDVKILSRSLEAKLTSCCCSFIGYEERSYIEKKLPLEMKSRTTTLTVIFSPKTCNDVELEVGNLIRIFSPWKEVNIQEKDELIILCTYFIEIPN